MSLYQKTFLVTGGAGSFGQKFTEIVLKEYDPKSIRIYDSDELRSVEMDQRLQDSRLRVFMGDVRDKDRLGRAMNGVDIVVHAAALKHVPICEYNPIEAVRTNVDGTVNVIDAAIANNVEKAITLSTDKAVHPVNLYGATKMVAEKLFVQGNSYVGPQKRTRLSCTRYGNVVASNGSVIPLFLEQRKYGEIRMTDERMTRFWITLEQGARFVLKSLERMQGGEIFIPKIPSMKLVDLAEAVAPGVPRRIIGIRPGEKIHEVLLTEHEANHAKEFEDSFVIEPEFPFWKENGGGNEGEKMKEGFRYVSDANDWCLSPEELKRTLKEML
ncbi:MAG: UDP-N-acetylglucosamine 4,6-dehydratase (inverting) [Candidatus Yanofskybacteria bacterium]|nr:UDP-N-acetylglucosamine 4,6-dehydratase (inverting) [Candidatus Yanofskybacteria bacterium]